MNGTEGGALLMPLPSAPCCLRLAQEAPGPHLPCLLQQRTPVCTWRTHPMSCWQHLSWRLPGSRLQKGNGHGTQSNSESGVHSVSSEEKGPQVQANTRRWGRWGVGRWPREGGDRQEGEKSTPDVYCCSWAGTVLVCSEPLSLLLGE